MHLGAIAIASLKIAVTAVRSLFLRPAEVKPIIKEQASATQPEQGTELPSLYRL